MCFLEKHNLKTSKTMQKPLQLRVASANEWRNNNNKVLSYISIQVVLWVFSIYTEISLRKNAQIKYLIWTYHCAHKFHWQNVHGDSFGCVKLTCLWLQQKEKWRWRSVHFTLQILKSLSHFGEVSHMQFMQQNPKSEDAGTGTYAWRWVIPWTSCQFITGLTYRDKANHPHSYIRAI